MSYSSLSFAVFFLILLILYYLVPKKIQWCVLLCGSIVFYLFSGPKYLIYVLVTTLVTFFAALIVYKKRQTFSQKLPELEEQLSQDQLALAIKKNNRIIHFFMTMAVVVDLGILIVLKYTNFVISNINTFLPETSALPLFSFVLPLGLSFYTFSAVGYVVDVSREKYKPEKNFAKFFLYLTYFPQIVQGPIPSFDRLAHQLYAGHAFNFKNIKYGYQLVLWGLFKKLVIADAIAPLVVAMLADVTKVSGLEIWLGMFIWGLQIYADFSGGVDVSRGVSQMLDITMDLNFTRPYFALNLNDFWNRWHMSLGNWLKDYFFYPIAFSSSFSRITKWTKKKFGKFVAKTVPVGILSLFLFTIIGIWHGANWGETLFGVFNGVVILISTLIDPFFAKQRKKYHYDQNVGYRIFCAIRTFLLITLARVFSRPLNIVATGSMFLSMFGFNSGHLPFFSFTGNVFVPSELITYLPALLGCILLFFVSLIEEKGKSIRDIINSKPVIIGIVIAALGTAAIVLFGAYGVGYEASNFIYQQY